MRKLERPTVPTRVVVPAPAAGMVDRARQERFLRQLVPSPWDTAPDDDAAPGLDDTALAIEAVEDEGRRGSAGDDSREPQDGDAPVEPPVPPETTPPITPDRPPFQPSGWAAAASTRSSPARDGSDDAPSWLQDMAQQVARLCTEGDPRFQCWSVTLPLDPAVLPDCELRLELSPGAMTLRFRTASPQSAALVCRHRDALRARLEALPSSPPAIDIDLE